MSLFFIVDEVAIIDEIQLIRDPGRGWAWTRALLGIAANEIHLCGEEAAIDLVSVYFSNLFTFYILHIIFYLQIVILLLIDKCYMSHNG